MKNLLFTLALLISFSSFGQSSQLLTVEMDIVEKQNNTEKFIGLWAVGSQDALCHLVISNNEVSYPTEPKIYFTNFCLRDQRESSEKVIEVSENFIKTVYSEEGGSNFSIFFIKYELLNDNTIQTTLTGDTGDYEGEIILYRVELEKL